MLPTLQTIDLDIVCQLKYRKIERLKTFRPVAHCQSKSSKQGVRPPRHFTKTSTMKFTESQDEMESGRRAVATCRAELELAENLVDALKHEIEVRECHLKMAEASIHDEAIVYCERKVRTYRPELGTCEDEHWKVVKNWAGVSIVEIQHEVNDDEVVNLRREVENLRRVNESLRHDIANLKASANSNSHPATVVQHNQQQDHIYFMTNENISHHLNSTGELYHAFGAQQFGAAMSTQVVSGFQNEFGSNTHQNRPSTHRRYTLSFLPPDALAHARFLPSSPSLPAQFQSLYGISASDALEHQSFTRLIELANLHYIFTFIEGVPAEIFQERTGGEVDSKRFREMFRCFLEACLGGERKITSDGRLELDDGAWRMYLELRNAGGRAAERWEVLREVEREFL